MLRLFFVWICSLLPSALIGQVYEWTGGGSSTNPTNTSVVFTDATNWLLDGNPTASAPGTGAHVIIEFSQPDMDPTVLGKIVIPEETNLGLLEIRRDGVNVRGMIEFGGDNTI